MPIILQVNGERHEVGAAPGASLLSVLRDELGLLATRHGCGQGQCGACAVLADGRALLSCVTPAAEAADRELTTVEGLASGDQLHPVQAAFLEEDALQCGFCTSGMMMAAVALLEHNPAPTEDEIRDALGGHLCRCGVYGRVLRAVARAAGGAR
jgi:aerobic-type carbon monoxide dehydrogenase small subunit (CoxS/CutS family)